MDMCQKDGCYKLNKAVSFKTGFNTGKKESDNLNVSLKGGSWQIIALTTH